MQHGRVEAESVTHNYYNSSTKSKFYKNTRLAGKIIEKKTQFNQENDFNSKYQSKEILIQQGKRKQHKILKYFILP